MNTTLEQSTMTFNRERWPGAPGDTMNGIHRGIVVPGSVRTYDTNNAKQTLVDVYLYNHMPALRGVPLLAEKANAKNGTWHDPEDNDLVAVMFLGGDTDDPVVVGYLPTQQKPETALQTKKKDSPGYRHRHQKTETFIDKDGNRTVTVEKDDTLTIKGNGKIIVTEGALEINVLTGGAKITVKGDATISAANVSIIAKQLIKMNTPLVECSGNMKVTGTVTAAAIVDSIGALAELRILHQSHAHEETGTGGGITSTPLGG